MKFASVITLALALAIGAFGQDIPNNFGAAGLGFQSTASPQTSGWSEYCHRNPDLNLFGLKLPSFSCAATDYAGSATSARVDVDTVLLHRSWLSAGTKTGGGAAVNQYGIGGSFVGGAWGALNVSNWLKVDGLHLVGSVTWSKDDVLAAQQAGPTGIVLRQLAARGVYRFGVGKSW